QGLIYKHCLVHVLKPMYDKMDHNKLLRSFAEKYIYTNPKHADFFAISLLLLLNYGAAIAVVFYWQLSRGHLPYWLIAAYYFAWVGVGGRMMGGAYALAHKEGHCHTMYKRWIRDSFGHVFENVLGVLVGNVPWNFTTSHVFIHHRLDGGLGDTFYLWDLDRSSLSDFMLYIHRIFLHMTGYSSLKFFDAHGHKAKSALLRKGVITYLVVAVVMLAITRSPAFIFWIYVQPFICMTYFLALLNIGFHGFLEYANGKNIECVNSSTIIGGEDDYFGEDDHRAHHYFPSVYYTDLDKHQESQMEDFKKHKASVFQKLSILELSIFILFGLWDKLAEHYVDYTGKMSREEIMEMLKVRAQRKETTYEQYV
ncbi:unnamed protein product, partial [Ectocarpus fasciculatus]